MKKIDFYVVRNDTGSSFNSFTGHYSSPDAVTECFKKNTDFIESKKNEAYNALNTYSKTTRVVNSKDDFIVTFKIIENELQDHWSSDSRLKLVVEVTNIKIAIGELIDVPEIKEEGKPYQSASSRFVQISEKTTHQTFGYPIRREFLLLDVIHLNYKKIVDQDGNLIEE